MTELKGTIVISASLTFFTPEKVMNRKSLLLTAALSFAVAAPVFAQGGGGGGGGGAGGGAGGAAASGGASGSSASSGAGTGTSGAANGGPSAPSGMGTNGTSTGAHTNNSPTNPNVQPPTPNGNTASTPAAPGSSGTSGTASGSTQTGTPNGTDRSGITATNGANSDNKGQMSPAEQARTGVKTLPQDQTPGAVSAPGVGVGHAANGLPIGTPGSGTSNVDQK
jgi:hypothetical protein